MSHAKLTISQEVTNIDLAFKKYRNIKCRYFKQNESRIFAENNIDLYEKE